MTTGDTVKTITTVREYDAAGRMVRETVTEHGDSSSPKRLGQPRIPLPRSEFDPSNCPCNPARGGSGICGCIMAGPTITCAVSA